MAHSSKWPRSWASPTREGRSLSALWHDFDDDGWPDLYVANDISENKLFLNRHGKFVDAGRAWRLLLKKNLS